MSNNIPNIFPMGETLSSTYTAKTAFGTFEIKITNRDYINIGSKHFCVQIAYSITKNTAKLDWLGTEEGGCEATGKAIHGEDTVKMTDLGFTILKQLYPNVNPNISLRDSSSFKCRLPNNKLFPISLMKYYLLIYGETYYQQRFNAKLQYEELIDTYAAFIKNRNNPKLFDKSYDFGNTDLNESFRPLMATSNNWGEFFNKLYKQFGRNTCALVHSWYLDVYGFLARPAIHTDWVIDIQHRPEIDYEIIKRNNSKNYTRKSYTYNPYEFTRGGGYFPSLIKYKKILYKPTHKGYTLKKNIISN